MPEFNNEEIEKRVECMKRHQKHWKKYSVGSPGSGRASFAVCSRCGARHLLNDVITTQEDIDRRIANL